MIFNIVEAQPVVWDFLNRIIDRHKVGNAYLFSGPTGSGKEAMAIEFGAAVNKQLSKSNNKISDANYLRFKNLQHELLKLVFPLPGNITKKENGNPLDSLKPNDLQLINEILELKANDPFIKIAIPGATRILINSIRELRKTIYLKSDDVGRKFVIIFDAHLLCTGQMESANALLKMLEEPPPNTTMILVTDNKDQLLSTILSRCQHIDFPPLDKRIIKNYLLNKGIENKSIDIIAELSSGDVRKALSIAKQDFDDLISNFNEICEIILDKNGNEWRSFIIDNARLARTDPSKFKFNMFLLQIWFRSVFHLKHEVKDGLHKTILINKMKKFTEEYPNANLNQINILIEDSLEAVGKNLYMSLTLTNLLINIHKNLQ
jgi:DNA polymerase-3 subunit delta'